MTRLALGLMSGTSLDGIDAALIESDGKRFVRPLGFFGKSYPEPFRARLRAALGQEKRTPSLTVLEEELTLAHAAAVEALLNKAAVAREAITVIGFHGQTLFHAPDRGLTFQLGDGQLLADRTGIAVVNDLRAADVAAGGQGAPLVPLYHQALAQELERPLAILNLGGVGNLTWLGMEEEEILAFDTGPGNALLDDWLKLHEVASFDEGGRFSASGRVDTARVEAFLGHPFFKKAPPKSLDRDAFDLFPQGALSLEDGAATLVAMTAAAARAAWVQLPAAPKRLLVTGGGRHNPSLMQALKSTLSIDVAPVEAVGWNGDSLEAEAFAYLALRSLDGASLSLPTTTGVPRPLTGGRLWHPGYLQVGVT